MNEKRKLKKSVGNWVSGDLFFGREAELRDFMADLEDGASVSLLGMRRLGKTSLMREAADRLGGRYICLHVDLERSKDEADAVVEMMLAAREVRGIWKRCLEGLGEAVRRVMDRIDKLNVYELGVTLRSALVAAQWQKKGDELFAFLAEEEKPVVLFFDEVPLLVNRILKGDDRRITPERVSATSEFLYWLRANTQRYQGRLRVVLAGSIGLEPVLHQAGLSETINHLKPFLLEPWAPQTACACLQALAAEYGLTFEPGADQEIVSRIGCCVPHHVQMFFDFLERRCEREEQTTVTVELVGRVYDLDMLSVKGHVELSSLEERLKVVLAPSSMLALDMLTEACLTGVLTADAALLLAAGHTVEGRPEDAVRWILLVLQHDGYLRQSETGFVFVSNLLRDWWKARFSFGYVPAAKRRKPSS